MSKIINEKEYINRREMRILLGVSDSTITNLLSDDAFPAYELIGKNRFWPKDDVLKFNEKKSSEKYTSVEEQIDVRRKKKADADKAELDVAIMKKEYQPVSLMVDVLNKVHLAVKNKIEAIPSQMSGIVLGMQTQREIELALEEYCEKILEELCQLKI